ncbi:MAG: DUF2304 domain-containing protein [Propionibacteriaceae bacterium]|jgi:hypothetical protein|nr:DUF2304 domain-containing protein [Propionibacteriaceae bacterium]
MSGYWFALALCLVLVVSLIQLLRRRRIREKYVALWIVVALAVIVLGAFPDLISGLARLVGVQVPSNLVFSVALLFLLIVCVQLSVAVSALEERTRTLTEEVALLRAEQTADDQPDETPDPADA